MHEFRTERDPLDEVVTTPAPIAEHPVGERSPHASAVALAGPAVTLPRTTPTAGRAQRAAVFAAPSATPTVAGGHPRIQRRIAADATVIRRKGGRELTTKTATAALTSIPVINAELAKNTAQGPSIGANVQTQLALFDKHLKRKSAPGQVINEAIRIATVIDATAASLAMSVGDPTLKGRIATELVAAYRAELTQALATTKDDGARTAQTDQAVTIAAAIVGDDPLLLYMNDKVKRPDAAWRIRAMGEQGNLFPHEMFRILKDRLMMYLGSFTANQVTAGQRSKDTITSVDSSGTAKTGEASFDLEDLIGELSLTQFNANVQLDRTNKKYADKPPAWVDHELAMTPAAIGKLAALEQAVSSPALQKTDLTPTQLAAEQAKSGAGLTAKQSEHFHRLRQEELDAAADYESSGKSPRAYCVAKFVSRYKIDAGRAGTIIDDFVQALQTVPLTLTNDLESLFGVRPDAQNLPKYGSEYKSEPARMQQQVDIGQMIGKPAHAATAMAMGTPDPAFTTSRGANYMRWRRDKDERETGYHGLSADELPTFGAVNPNFDYTKGGNANFAEWNTTTKQYEGIDYGKNYYGDVHFLLDDAVRPRSTFVARGKMSVEGRRIERTDLVFLLADMIRLYMWDYVDAIVSDTQAVGKTVLTNMDAEVHIYGRFDLADDVAEMYLLPAAYAVSTTPGTASYRARQFAEANGIIVKDIGARPVGYQVHARQGVQGGIDLADELNP